MSEDKTVWLPGYIWLKVVLINAKPISADCPLQVKYGSRPPSVMEVFPNGLQEVLVMSKKYRLETSPCIPFVGADEAVDWANAHDYWFKDAKSFHLVEIDRL